MGLLEAGVRAPEFELTDGTGKVWRLSDLRGRKVILYFYPTDDTPGCTRQACDFRDTHSDWTEAGYVVLGVSAQGAGSKQKFVAKYDLNFPLLIDADRSVQDAYGAGRGQEDLGPSDLQLKTNRSTFVIDEQGTIVAAMYGVRAKGHVDSLKTKLGV